MLKTSESDKQLQIKETESEVYFCRELALSV